MFVREHQNQFRGAQADVQRYYGAHNVTSQFVWNKPTGASLVYIMLIGCGGESPGASFGGGSGAITVWFGPAKHIPNSVCVNISKPQTSIIFNNISATETTVFVADGGTQNTRGSASTANGYYLSGLHNFTAGIDGSTSAAAASTTTFLSQGSAATTSAANYGYAASSSGNGFFLLSPLPVGVSSCGTFSAPKAAATYGCGSPLNTDAATFINPPGMAIIASW